MLFTTKSTKILIDFVSAEFWWLKDVCFSLKEKFLCFMKDIKFVFVFFIIIIVLITILWSTEWWPALFLSSY